jgi:hypothetical protein
MARTAMKQRPKAKKAKRGAMPREVRAAYSEIQKGVAHLDESIVDLRAGLRRAERKIEADARRQIRALRTEARTQLQALQSKQREAARTLKKVSAAAGESWREVKRSADAILADARATAASVGQRFRRALRD